MDNLSLAAKSVRLSVIIPAYNEEDYLRETLASVHRAIKHLQQLRPSDAVEIIVVDNDSTDQTNELARSEGCRVVREMEHNISKVRNRGAGEASGDTLVFIDADTLVPVNTLALIAGKMDNPNCIGGAVDVYHQPSKRLIRFYLAIWRVIGTLMGMAQGATQFCRSSEFHKLGAYDESIFMGEDVDFYWKMKRYAKQKSCEVVYLDEVRVIPSLRRFDQWPIWKTIVMTNPLLILLFRKTKKAWSAWYENRPV